MTAVRTAGAVSLRDSSTPTGLVWFTNMAAVLLFWNTNMAAMTFSKLTVRLSEQIMSTDKYPGMFRAKRRLLFIYIITQIIKNWIIG